MRDVAIDLGTATTLVHVRGKGVVLREPTVIALDERTGELLAIGEEAWRTIDAAPGPIVPVRPIRHGTITDFSLTEGFLRLIFARLGVGRLGHPRAVVTVSSGASLVERRALEEAALGAGARSASLVDQPIAAAIGAGLPIDRPAGNCVIDVGGGTTEVAVISMGGVVAARAVRVGGFDLDDAVERFCRREYGMAVGERAAEAIKCEIGSAHPDTDAGEVEVKGRDLGSGTPVIARLRAQELRAALDEGLAQIVDAVRGTLADTPPDLAHDVIEGGIVLCGGGAMLAGLDRRLGEETGIPIHRPARPDEVVVVGAANAAGALARLREQGILLG